MTKETAPQGALAGADFDFDGWAALARHDPERFERMRRDHIEGTLARARPGNRLSLERLQFRIDAQRRRAGTPLKSCLSTYSMMWDAFLGLDEALNRLVGRGAASGPDSGNGLQFSPSARILPFRRP